MNTLKKAFEKGQSHGSEIWSGNTQVIEKMNQDMKVVTDIILKSGLFDFVLHGRKNVTENFLRFKVRGAGETTVFFSLGQGFYTRFHLDENPGFISPEYRTLQGHPEEIAEILVQMAGYNLEVDKLGFRPAPAVR